MEMEARRSAVTPRPSALMPGSGTGYLAGTGVGADSQIEKNMACKAEQKQRRYPRRDLVYGVNPQCWKPVRRTIQPHLQHKSFCSRTLKNAFGKVWFKDVLRCSKMLSQGFESIPWTYERKMKNNWFYSNQQENNRIIEAGFLSGKVIRVL